MEAAEPDLEFTEDLLLQKKNVATMSVDGRLCELKQLCLQQEFPLEVEYLFVRCCSCYDCSNADTTEKVSLQEEAKLQQCKDSIKLDYCNR